MSDITNFCRRERMRMVGTLTGIVASAALASCGATTTSTAANGGPTITAADFSFTPSTLNVAPGSTVTLTLKNTGSSKHNFTTEGGPTANQDLDPGSTQTVTFTAPQTGSFSFHCEYHPKAMTGTISVGSAGGAGSSSAAGNSSSSASSASGSAPATASSASGGGGGYNP